MPSRRAFLFAAGAGAVGASLRRAGALAQARGVQVLHPSGGVPAHIAGEVKEPYGFRQGPDGDYFVFDRRAHTVWRISPGLDRARAIVTIGQEQGKLYSPSAFDVGPAGTFVVADAPGDRERVQVFDGNGIRLTGFTLPGHAAARITLGTSVMNGVSSLLFTGTSILINRPEDGALVSEYSIAGSPIRSVGPLRATGHERDRDLHVAFNSGLPLLTRTGEIFFVFFAGEPRFRKYDAKGTLLFERLLQGREVDAIVAGLPTTWPRRKVAGDELPLVPPSIRTGAVDPAGQLWIALADGTIYVFDADGEKTRTVRLEGTGPLLPTSLSLPTPTRLLVAPGLYEFTVE